MVKRALLIGINYVKTPQIMLRGCINDVLTMQNMLIDAYDYSKSNIIVLRDDDFEKNENFHPTYENIIKNLKNVINESNKNDEIWIHYSGHGTYIPDTNGDEKDKKDECLVPSDVYEKGIITDDLLFGILSKSTCKIYLTIDCCHSGTMFDLNYKFVLSGTRVMRETNKKYLNNKNIYMYSGARDIEPAMDSVNYEQNLNMGAFTEALVKCLRYNHHNVQMLKLYYDINKYLETNGFTQRCVFTSSNPLPFMKIQKSNIYNNSRQQLLNSNIIKRNMRNMRNMIFT